MLGFLKNDVLAAARPEGQKGRLGVEATVCKAVDAAEPKIAERFKDQPIVEAEVRDTLEGTHSYLSEAPLAIRQIERVLELRQTRLGPDRPDTLTRRNNLAATYQTAGRTAEAIKMHEATLKMFGSKLGPGHPNTLVSRANLSKAYASAGRTAEADPLLRDGLERARKRFGSADPRTAAEIASLGSNLIQQRKWAEAETILRECMAIRAKGQPDDWSTFNTRSQLGGSLLGQKKFADAEPLILAGYDGMKAREAKIPAPGKPRLTEAAERIVQLYEAWGKKEKAAESRAKVGKGPAEAKNKP